MSFRTRHSYNMHLQRAHKWMIYFQIKKFSGMSQNSLPQKLIEMAEFTINCQFVFSSDNLLWIETIQSTILFLWIFVAFYFLWMCALVSLQCKFSLCKYKTAMQKKPGHHHRVCIMWSSEVLCSTSVPIKRTPLSHRSAAVPCFVANYNIFCNTQ